MIADLHPTFPRETTPIWTALDVERIAAQVAASRRANEVEPLTLVVTKDDGTTEKECSRHQCGDCGRWVPQDTVHHGGGYPDYEYWASGDCSRCGEDVDVWCMPQSKGWGA